MMATTKALFFFLLLTVGLSLPMGSEEPGSEDAALLDKGVDSQEEPATSVVEATESSPQNTEAQLTGKPTETDINADTNEETVTDPTIPPAEKVETTATEVEPTQPENSIKSTPTEIQADSAGLDDASAAAPSGPEPDAPAAETEPSQIPDSQPEDPKTTVRGTDADVAAEPNIPETTSDVNEVEPGTAQSPVTPPESLVPATNVNDQANVADSAGDVDVVELSAGERTPVVPVEVTEVPGDVAASEVDEANAEQETLNRPEEGPAGSEDKQEVQPQFEEENQSLQIANEELEESQEKPRVEAAEDLAISQFELRTSLLAAMLGVSHLLLHAF